MTNRITPDLDLMEIARRASRATPAELSVFEARVQRDPNDLIARVALIGNSMTRSRSTHILWLIRNAPWAKLNELWLIPSDQPAYKEGKELWLAAIRTYGSDSLVAANAAQYLWLTEPDLAEQLLIDGIGTTATILHHRKALDAFYDSRIIALRSAGHAERVPPVASSALENLRAVFELEADDEARASLFWRLRHYAGMARKPGLAALYAAAEDANKGAPHPHHANTARGLMALAGGDLAGALKWLNESARHFEGVTAPDAALAEALIARGEAVAEYVAACSERFGRACDTVRLLNNRTDK